VHEIVARGGRCLIPAFALGRAQELLLILDEYWEQHPELHDIPVYCKQTTPLENFKKFFFSRCQFLSKKVYGSLSNIC